MFCTKCAKEMSDTATACPSCGHPVRQIGKKNKVTFVLLAVLFGGAGIHRFYLGNIGLGILYLLFCWTFIPMLVAIIEAIVIGLRDGDPRFNT